MMKAFLLRVALLGAIASLSGCYYDPGYSYVRATGYSGDVYYGQAAPVYQGGYGYAPFGYGYDGGYYGCCDVGIVGGWYGGPRYYGGRGYYPGRYGYGGRWGGHWQGHPPYRGGRPGYGGHADRTGGHGYGHGFRGGAGYRGTH